MAVGEGGACGLGAGGEGYGWVPGWAAKTHNTIRSLGWWQSSKREKGAREGQPSHARSGPRRRWEKHLHLYAVAKRGESWIDSVQHPDAMSFAKDFAYKWID